MLEADVTSETKTDGVLLQFHTNLQGLAPLEVLIHDGPAEEILKDLEHAQRQIETIRTFCMEHPDA